MAQTIFVALAVVVLVALNGAGAKRGCSAFGHSCFGGHGKRSSDNSAIDNPEMMAYRHQTGQEEIPPHPVYPQSSLTVLQPGDDIIPVRDGGVYDHDDSGAIRDIMKYRLRNIVKHWMENYRRNQQNGDEGFYVENL